MKYVLFCVDNATWDAAVELFNTREEAVEEMQKWFDSDVRIILQKRLQQNCPATVDYSDYSDILRVSVSKNSMHAEFVGGIDDGDQYHYQILETEAFDGDEESL